RGGRSRALGAVRTPLFEPPRPGLRHPARRRPGRTGRADHLPRSPPRGRPVRSRPFSRVRLAVGADARQRAATLSGPRLKGHTACSEDKEMRIAQWARLQEPARCGLRWGAWYPVMGLTPREARLWVRGHAMVVARSLLELSNTQPHEWTVARSANGAEPYVVCPSCRHRAHLPDGRT